MTGRPTKQSSAGRAYLDLQNRARRERRGTQELLTMYVVERWLARLSRSAFVDDFVLKGGMLLAAFGNRRPTVDADALARNLSADEETVAARVAEIAALPDLDDGVEFLPDTVTTSVIRDEALYAGVRVTLTARLATAQVKLRLDINFGDPVTPAPQMIELPALRPDTVAVRVWGYPVESVLAEKITTAIGLGPASTRVRDWADIYTLIGTRKIDGATARAALESTAAFRGTTLIPLSRTVGELVELRNSTYTAYRRNLGPDGEPLPERFGDTVAAVIDFADPLLSIADLAGCWNPESHQWERDA
ncbi:nucleotidyltransferase AbiEii toxin of type IV toxin-antitoxin system [Tamaricihabitans halophyticus]|uniref:Nucleotidyltransferase AbiEii toxin of type IV toxin-antitoxin system n=1 Tax=Tamaricihabitans halophyticus TaxID=1262583 RepID=A0A4R2QT23_9PSEU|nr:nucleotidyl transferase AbiEii/AbiGii toxin family protein [Tamaricihabitans halophyticus]TCP53062.1 nucleotidyltransferase AbiEii toxin of type IV toxin-antitoxin system [Tamaricihabitans halophyticus]